MGRNGSGRSKDRDAANDNGVDEAGLEPLAPRDGTFARCRHVPRCAALPCACSPRRWVHSERPHRSGIPLDSYNKRRLGAAEVAKPGNVALLMKQTLLPRFYGSCGLERPAGGGGHGALQAGGAQRPASSSKLADRSMQAASSERIGGVEER